jgi:hypothetical protein
VERKPGGRRPNEKTVGNAHPRPDTSEILDQLGESKYFSCMDMVMGHHQIELREGDRKNRKVTGPTRDYLSG